MIARLYKKYFQNCGAAFKRLHDNNNACAGKSVQSAHDKKIFLRRKLSWQI